MSGWDKVKVVTGIVATVVIPLAVGFVGHQYSMALKEREIGARYVELAIGILRSPPSDEFYDIRSWAVELIEWHSGVGLTLTQKAELIRTGALENMSVIGGRPLPPQLSEAVDAETGGPAEPDDRVTVPNVRGLTVSQASEVFGRAGLEVPDALTEQPVTAIVNVQDPPAGTRAARGTVISVGIGDRATVPRNRLSRPIPD